MFLVQSTLTIRDLFQVHSDFKPLNAVRLPGGAFRLIDLDAATDIGEAAGIKTSTAYCPPEMTFVDQLVEFKKPGILASPSYDFWSCGCVLYRALARRPLFEADDADNMYSQHEMQRLCKWSTSDLDASLRDVSFVLSTQGVDPAQCLYAVDLLKWLMHPNEICRPISGHDILRDRFFSNPGGSSPALLHMSDLHRAAALGELESVQQAVVTHGISIEDAILSDQHLLKKTPLHLAAIGLHEDVVRLLLQMAETGSTAITSEQYVQQDPTAFASFIVPKVKPETLLHKCLNKCDSQLDTPLHSLLKVVDRFTSDVELLEMCIRIIRIFSLLTDSTIVDAHGRTAFDVGCASPVSRVREYFSALRIEKADRTRCDLFRETVLGGNQAATPWGLPKGKFQTWLRCCSP